MNHLMCLMFYVIWDCFKEEFYDKLCEVLIHHQAVKTIYLLQSLA